MPGFIVPVAEGGQIQVTDEMRRDAAATAAGMEGGGQVYLYLCQSTSKVVKKRKEAQDADYIINGFGEKAVVLGKTCNVIVLSQCVRMCYEVKDESTGESRVVWDVPRDSMTDEQAAQADLPWEDPRAAKPYNAFMLLHVGQEGLDPHNIGPFSFHGKGLSAKPAKKWVTDILNAAARGVPAFSIVWQLGSVEVGGKKDTMWNAMTHKQVGTIPGSHPLYAKLKTSWQHAQALIGKASPRAGGGEPNYGEIVDDHHASADDIVVEDGPADHTANDYATSLPVEETALPKSIPYEAANAGMDFTSALSCAPGVRKPVEIMTEVEAIAAYRLAKPHCQDEKHGKRARGACALLQEYANANKFDPDAFDLPPF